MSFYDVHELTHVKATGPPLFVNNLRCLNDDTLLPVVPATPSTEHGHRPTSAWTTADATTLDAQGSTRLCLDSRPMKTHITDYWSIYDKNFDGNRYKSIYYHREDLPGQIQYYVHPEMTNPFFTPLFPKNTRALGAVYVDPMNTVHYDFQRPWRQDQLCGADDCQITEIRDSQGHREDILAHVMRPRNKHEYEPVYYNFSTRYR